MCTGTCGDSIEWMDVSSFAYVMFQLDEKIAYKRNFVECSQLFPIIDSRFCVSRTVSKLDGVLQVREMESRTFFFCSM